ncbi:MAG TPA: phospholipase D-like domain-containing protein [Candidatus Kapabacteria bacterium]|nr:phospholipase D-like domain-containing protein [Candidatus Kapabacteria bacterium]
MSRAPNRTDISGNSVDTLPRPRLLAEQAFSRAAGAPLSGGNHLRLLRDAAAHYPAWLNAIRSAQHSIHLENYIIENDRIGREFMAALAERARAGVQVRVLHDWVGGFSANSPTLFRPLVEAGGEVRTFNPVRFDNPLSWLTRDHRKSLVIDGRLGYVTGVCISARWLGDPARGIAPWRDTGIEISGPAVTDIAAAFAQAWATCGTPLPASELPVPGSLPATGNTSLRVIASMPSTSGMYRLDQLIAAVASETLWLTDAYFVATPVYVQALCAAAQDGVDVRLLVPSTSDIPLVSPLSRASYRPLLEAGVRVFEWNGSMIHAKTAVADGRWARVGSSNLNLASWISNYELDVAVEDTAFAEEMEAMYLQDLENATEIILAGRNVKPVEPLQRRRTPRAFREKGSGMTTAMRLGNTVASALRQQRVLGAAEAGLLAMLGVFLLLLAVVGLYWPRLLAMPMAGISLWLAIWLLGRAWRLHRLHRPPPTITEPPKKSADVTPDG